ADLIDAALERALSEGNVPVILGAAQALGDRGELRLARPTANTAPRGLTRALYYPDRRVQLAAARALLQMPGTPAPVGAARVVEILRRFLAAEPTPRVVLLFVPADRTGELRKAFKGAGYEAVFVAGVKEAFEELHRAADVDAVFIDYTAPQAELPYILTQLRSDPDVGLLPVLLIEPPAQKRPDDKEADVLSREQFQNNLARLADRYRNTWV